MGFIAQLDENGVCFAVSNVGKEVSGENVVALKERAPEGYSSHADYYCGRKYEDGEWSAEIPVVQESESTPVGGEYDEEPVTVPYEIALLREIRDYLLLNMRLSLEARDWASEADFAEMPEAVAMAYEVLAREGIQVPHGVTGRYQEAIFEAPETETEPEQCM